MSFLKDSEKLHPQLTRIQTFALFLGVVGLLFMIVGLFFDKDQFFQSYLLGYIFWVLLALGALSILMIQHVERPLLYFACRHLFRYLDRHHLYAAQMVDQTG